jgi:hypothetical protein
MSQIGQGLLRAQSRPGLIDKHLPILSRVLRSSQEVRVIFGGVLLLFCAGVQLLLWTGVDSAATKMIASGVVSLISAGPGLFLIRSGLRPVPPLLRRLDEAPGELGAIHLDYVISGGMTMSRLQFVFRDGRGWSVTLPADVGKQMARDFAAAFPWVTTGERR